jgi:hypothetical protein
MTPPRIAEEGMLRGEIKMARREVGPVASEPKMTGLGHSGNVLFRRKCCFRAGHAFNPQLGFFGSEDGFFFLQLERTGASMVWCREAITREVVPFQRTTHAYILRCIVRGQSTPLIHSMLRPPDWRSVAWFMMAGTLQFPRLWLCGRVCRAILATPGSFDRRAGR